MRSVTASVFVVAVLTLPAVSLGQGRASESFWGIAVGATVLPRIASTPQNRFWRRFVGHTNPGASVTLAVRAGKRSPAPSRTTIGFELDALPYITGGYYGSIWLGHDRIRLRPVVAKTTLPSFVVQDGFDHADVRAYAIIADYFFRDNFRGFWMGAGAEYWRNSVERTLNGATASWDNTIATLGGGYVWTLAGNFYVNPWGAVHLIIAGHSDLQVGGATYSPKRLTPELSLKIGWHF